jgi:hypothetical protein
VAAGDAGIAARVVTATTLKNPAIRMTWFTVSFLSTIRYPVRLFADSELIVRTFYIIEAMQGRKMTHAGWKAGPGSRGGGLSMM